MLLHKQVSKPEWLIPVGLVAGSFIPLVAGALRVIELAAGTAITPENARFAAAPIPVVLHIIGAVLFSLLGAFQFSEALRQRRPQWHKVSGRVVAASGVVVALSGIWMTLMYPIPAALQGSLLFGVRLLVGTAMLVAIVLAVTAAMHSDITKHRAWMIRGYALGLGAGTQVVVLLPWMLIVGTPSTLQRDVLMSLAWLINLAVAEVLIQKPPLESSVFTRQHYEENYYRRRNDGHAVFVWFHDTRQTICGGRVAPLRRRGDQRLPGHSVLGGLPRHHHRLHKK